MRDETPPTIHAERMEQQRQIRKMIEEAAKALHTTPEALICHDRTSWKVTVRDEIMWRARRELKASYPTIAGVFRYNHTAVMAAVRRYERR